MKAASRPTHNGNFFVWGTAAAVTFTFGILVTLIVVILANGLGFFWPSDIAVADLKDGGRVMGEIVRREKGPGEMGFRVQIKVGNRDLYGQDFRWIVEKKIASISHPQEAIVLERLEYGNFYGFLKTVSGTETLTPAGTETLTPAGTETLTPAGDPASAAAPTEAPAAAERWRRLRKKMEEVASQVEELKALGQGVAETSARMMSARQHLLGLKKEKKEQVELRQARAQLAELERRFSQERLEHNKMKAQVGRLTATFADASGKEKKIALQDIVRAHQPNGLSVSGKTLVYLSKLWELLSGEPREANTEGGLFPAIFGTVMMVMIMSVFCIPMGVVAAIYLREYAKEGWLVSLVRVAVYNMAGVPSIVYGVFGLGFFVYGVGAAMDSVLFSARLPAPTFGTGGILWASLTLALLTVPVVIVATEEALASIPRGIREGSLALGATQFQTLLRNLLPMAMPGIMTGFILAVSRAAGEVAPLMLTGVVKLAPALPLDGTFPFLHLDRKFMHLGFHIFDVGFQSPNVEAAKPMVYITTLLLVLIVILLSLAAIFLRNHMRKRFQTGTF